MNDLLKQTMSTFIYTEKQREIAGKDGEEVLNRVFGSESRIVAVLYRNNWGKTSWTRIESTAIRNRAYEQGYEFTTFIVVETPASLPKWLPKNRIWVGFERFGLQGAAGVIEARVQEAGGKPKEESVEEHAARMNRQIEAERTRAQLLGSEQGAKAAYEEAGKLFDELEKVCKKLEEPANMKFDLHREKHPAERMIRIFDQKWTLSVIWYCRFSNTLETSCLSVSIWDSRVGFPGYYHFEDPCQLEELQFNFDIVRGNEYRWKESYGKERSFSTEQLADFSMKMFLDKISKREKEKSRERFK